MICDGGHFKSFIDMKNMDFVGNHQIKISGEFAFFNSYRKENLKMYFTGSFFKLWPSMAAILEFRYTQENKHVYIQKKCT